jgi:hypothetical protein
MDFEQVLDFQNTEPAGVPCRILFYFDNCTLTDCNKDHSREAMVQLAGEVMETCRDWECRLDDMYPQLLEANASQEACQPCHIYYWYQRCPEKDCNMSHSKHAMMLLYHRFDRLWGEQEGIVKVEYSSYNIFIDICVLLCRVCDMSICILHDAFTVEQSEAVRHSSQFFTPQVADITEEEQPERGRGCEKSPAESFLGVRSVRLFSTLSLFLQVAQTDVGSGP